MSLLRGFKHALCAAAILALSPAIAASATNAIEIGQDAEGHVVAPAEVNGGPLHLIVDTAAQRTALAPAAVEALKLVADPERKAQMHGLTGMALVNLYPLGRFRFGPIERNDLLVPALVHADHGVLADGVLGMDVLAGHRMRLDLRANRIVLDEAAVAPAGRTPAKGRMLYGSFLLVPVTVNGVSVTAVVDTGSRGTIGNLALLRALGIDPKSPALHDKAIAGGATGQAGSFLVGFTGALSVDDAVIEQPIAFGDMPVFTPLGLKDQPAMILGIDALRKFAAVDFDFAKAELIVEP
jgi:predicted aspartyl protease